MRNLDVHDCHIVICDEAYTSITCGKCGHLYHKLGKKKYSSARRVVELSIGM
jgi:transposase